MLRLLRLLLLLLLPPPGSPEPPGLASLSPGAPLQAPDLLYADGLRAYAAGAWAPAVALLREALRSRAALGRARRDCGERCAAEPEPGPPETPGSWEPLLLRSALRRADCLTQCGARRLGPGGAARLRVGSALRAAFRRREPYNYLQRAYYQVGGARWRGGRGSPPGCSTHQEGAGKPGPVSPQRGAPTKGEGETIRSSGDGVGWGCPRGGVDADRRWTAAPLECPWV